MNASFLLGHERSWFVLTWDCSTVEGHSLCCMDRIKLLMGWLYAASQMSFCHLNPFTLQLPVVLPVCFLNSCSDLLPSDMWHRSIGLLPRVQFFLINKISLCQVPAGCQVGMNKGHYVVNGNWRLLIGYLMETWKKTFRRKYLKWKGSTTKFEQKHCYLFFSFCPRVGLVAKNSLRAGS